MSRLIRSASIGCIYLFLLFFSAITCKPMSLYIRIILIFFLRAHAFALAPLSETSDRMGTTRLSRSRCRRFRRDPCIVWRVASLISFLALGKLEANLRVFATSPGIGFCIPYPCVRTEDLDANRGFLLVEGTRSFPNFCTEHNATILTTSSSPAP